MLQEIGNRDAPVYVAGAGLNLDLIALCRSSLTAARQWLPVRPSNNIQEIRILSVWVFFMLHWGRVHTNDFRLCFGDGNLRNPIETGRASLGTPKRQREPVEPANAQRYPLRRRARLQLARPACTLRSLARDLHAYEPLVQEGWTRSGIHRIAAHIDRSHPDQHGIRG